MSGSRELERQVAAFAELLYDRGFTEEITLAIGRADVRIIRCREGRAFETEAVCILIQRLPTKAVAVELIGSVFSSEELRRRGLTSNGVRHNLHNFQAYYLDRDPSTLLPAVIEITGADPALDIIRRIGKELDTLSDREWLSMRQWYDSGA